MIAARNAWLRGMVAAFLVAGSWIAVLSWKYQQLTVASAARVAHTIIGPSDQPRFHPHDLSSVPPGRITNWETPELLSYNHWSPFENTRYLGHQMRHIWRTGKRVLQQIGSYDTLFFSMPILLFLPWFTARRGAWSQCRISVWALTTVAVYISGFLLVYYEERYTFAFLWPLMCILCMCFAPLCIQRVAARLQLSAASVTATSLLVVLSFAEATRSRDLGYILGMPHRATYRDFARSLEDMECHGPFAAVGTAWQAGVFAGYFNNVQFLGAVSYGVGPEEMETMLGKYGSRTLLVPSNDKFDPNVTVPRTWSHRTTLASPRGDILVYVPP